MQNDWGWYHARKKLQMNLIPGFTEKVLKVDFNNKYMNAKIAFKNVRNRLAEWPQVVLKQHQQFTQKLEEKKFQSEAKQYL